MSKPAKKTTTPSKPRRLLVGCLGILLLTLLFLGGSYAIYRYRVGGELEAALAEARAIDPALTIEELEAARAVVPPEENSAPRIIAAAALADEIVIPPDMVNLVQQTPPNQRFDPATAGALTAMLVKAAPALGHLRGLEELPRGRHDVQWAHNYIATSMDHAFATMRMTRLLAFRAEQMSESGQMDQALVACRAALNAGRSLGDEPALVSQLAHSTCLGRAVAAIERVLAQGVPAPEALATLQQALEQEDAVPILWIAVRGDRAGNHRYCQLIESGEMSVKVLANGGEGPVGIEEHFEDLIGREMMRRTHAYCLRYYSGFIKTAQRPCHERKPDLAVLREEMIQSPMLASILITSLEKCFRNSQVHHAKLRVALVALAAERYRQQHGHWPDFLEQLSPKFIEAIPLDPYDGKPLRLRRLADGVLIYSIGHDEFDNGGTINRQGNPLAPGLDVGFQLWDVVKRRQPAEQQR